MAPYRSIVVLTGAGISAESGIKTFRDANGLWENHRVEEVASPQGFAANPQLVHQFYNQRRHQLLHTDVTPNPAHLALANFEQSFGGEYLLVTQNVDNLHEQAGSKQLIHMHGELLKMRCAQSGKVYSITDDLTQEHCCDCCHQPGLLRPQIVWFGETPLEMDRIYQCLSKCDLFVAIGTSGTVYPAAGFVEQATQASADTVEINLEPSSVESSFGSHIYGLAGQEVPNFFANIN